MQQVRHLGIGIAVPFARAYDFAHKPANFARWAAGLASTLHETDEGWVADTPEGQATVVFSPPNEQGVLDHHVRLPDKPEIYVPLRMFANGDGTEVVLSLIRQPGMDDLAFERDAKAIENDLATLKDLLEN